MTSGATVVCVLVLPGVVESSMSDPRVMGIDVSAGFAPGADLIGFALDFACRCACLPGFGGPAMVLRLFPEHFGRGF